jgi:hypothetical protein
LGEERGSDALKNGAEDLCELVIGEDAGVFAAVFEDTEGGLER